MKWVKKSQILDLKNGCKKPQWIHSHAQNPVAIVLDDRVRVFFNTRKKLHNNEQIAYPSYVDLCKKDLSSIISNSQKPLLALGREGTFDEFGIMSSSVVRNNDELWMYYVGWTRMQSVPYNWAIGLAVSQDNGKSFKKMYQGPIVGALKDEPFLQNGCHVLRGNSGLWHMWYSSGIEWIKTEEKMESRYAIMHATSHNGIDWQRNAKTILPFMREDETQTTPTVFFYKNRFHMLFSYRNSINFRNKNGGYRIGYASSDDMIHWHRDDSKAGTDISDLGWDSEMVAYPHVIEIEGKTVMFYCGNNFGKNGFGYAVLED